MRAADYPLALVRGVLGEQLFQFLRRFLRQHPHPFLVAVLAVKAVEPPLVVLAEDLDACGRRRSPAGPDPSAARRAMSSDDRKVSRQTTEMPSSISR